ncbi:hypothetical protein BUALT_BualtUnG0031300 [Buddleja alternifolia]|uniref:Retrovirus-related Pol polyprotein from transposon TNT 1-94-like beta-barrel domain-containing protein n=1 Tax=Buddleja alternifolia TaxID=168488 RepID=A0AAV6W164_9LAMI|nr:hypothetical protein BUALT_BualtUnG0031300 [Buddleja alternifolia]
MQFLMELKNAFKPIRGQILLMKPLPSIEDAYFMLHQEERQMAVSHLPPIEDSTAAFLTNNSAHRSWTPPHPQNWSHKNVKSPLWCEHCQSPTHVISKCFKLHATDQQVQHSPPQLTAKQITQLLSLLPTPHPPTDSTPHLVGISQCFSTSHCSDTWILDSGATDHITHCLSSLHSSQAFSIPQSAHLPDGTISHITHVGTVPLTPFLTLHNVLYVPTFRHNLLSVSKLAHDYQCVISFTSTASFMQGHLLKTPVELGQLVNAKRRRLFAVMLKRRCLLILLFCPPAFQISFPFRDDCRRLQEIRIQRNFRPPKGLLELREIHVVIMSSDNVLAHIDRCLDGEAEDLMPA